MRLIHNKEKYKCPECNKEFSNLNQHLRVTHKIFKANTREKECEICHKKFFNLDAHRSKAHNIKLPTEFICGLCNKQFTKKDHLARHEAVVHLGLKQTCPICNQQFTNVDKHIKSKHNSTSQMVKETVKVLFSCNLCHKVFNKKDALNTHKLTAHNIEVPNNKETCPYCNKEFSSLNQHIDIVHRGEINVLKVSHKTMEEK